MNERASTGRPGRPDPPAAAGPRPGPGEVRSDGLPSGGSRSSAVRSGALVLLADAAAVTVFAAVGRASHDEASPVLGVLGTAWPFLTGVAAGWATVVTVTRDAPRTPRAAVPVWGGAVVVGMLLRVATGRGVATSFVVVATVVLGAFLLGWRQLATLVGRRLRRRSVPATVG